MSQHCQVLSKCLGVFKITHEFVGKIVIGGSEKKLWGLDKYGVSKKRLTSGSGNIKFKSSAEVYSRWTVRHPLVPGIEQLLYSLWPSDAI